MREHAAYNLQLMDNRVQLLLISKARHSLKWAEFLAPLYKILSEEFLKSNQSQLRDRYHENHLKWALGAGEHTRISEEGIDERIL